MHDDVGIAGWLDVVVGIISSHVVIVSLVLWIAPFIKFINYPRHLLIQHRVYHILLINQYQLKTIQSKEVIPLIPFIEFLISVQNKKQ